MEYLTVIAILVAIGTGLYGTVLSTFNYRARIKEKQRLVKLVLELKRHETISRKALIGIRVENCGQVPVHPRSPTLFIEPKTKVDVQITATATIPSPLASGDSFSHNVQARMVAKELQNKGHKGKVRLYATCKDKVNQEYRSDSIDFCVEDWTP